MKAFTIFFKTTCFFTITASFVRQFSLLTSN